MSAQLHLYPFVELWHPWVFAWILLIQIAYLLAVGPLREGFRWGAPVSTAQQISFSIGLWTIYLSEGTPLHILSEHYLFSMHMIQHILLTLILPPLVLMGVPAWMFRPVIRGRVGSVAARVLTHPVVALLAFNLIYSIWHMPLAYQSTLWHHGFHMVQHAILVFTAFMMWMPLVSPVPELPRLSPGAQMVYVFLMGISQIVVFGAITFADEVLYGFYAQAPRIWSAVTPELDQQIAGIIMKIGGMAVFLLTWGIVFFKWAAREGAQWGPSQSQPVTK